MVFKMNNTHDQVNILLESTEIDESNSLHVRLRFQVQGGVATNSESIEYNGDTFEVGGGATASEADKSFLKEVRGITGVMSVKLSPRSIEVVVDRYRVNWGSGYYTLLHALREHVTIVS